MKEEVAPLLGLNRRSHARRRNQFDWLYRRPKEAVAQLPSLKQRRNGCLWGQGVYRHPPLTEGVAQRPSPNPASLRVHFLPRPFDCPSLAVTGVEAQLRRRSRQARLVPYSLAHLGPPSAV